MTTWHAEVAHNHLLLSSTLDVLYGIAACSLPGVHDVVLVIPPVEEHATGKHLQTGQQKQ
jgi:hypothetical protein